MGQLCPRCFTHVERLPLHEPELCAALRQAYPYGRDVIHGTRTAYERGCRCDLCRLQEAKSKQERRRRQYSQAFPNLGTTV